MVYAETLFSLPRQASIRTVRLALVWPTLQATSLAPAAVLTVTWGPVVSQPAKAAHASKAQVIKDVFMVLPNGCVTWRE